MHNVKNPLMLLFLLSKRLYKKISFLVILLSLVLVSIVGKTALGQESSMLKIAVVAENNSIAESLVNSDGTVNYKYYSEQEADALLVSGKIDAVFKFNSDFDKKLDSFVADKTEESPIKVIIREKNVFINLALERVLAETFPMIADKYYYYYAETELGIDDQDALGRFYEEISQDNNIVEFSYYNSNDKVENTNYLLTPLRGMLATILLFCALASSLYFLTDCEHGNLDAVPINKRWFWQLLYTLAGAVNIAFFMMLSLVVTGLTENMLREVFMLVLYIIASVGFANVLSGICGKSKMLAAAMPIVTIAILAICPIFLNNDVRFVQELFPTYWYLTAIYNTAKIPMLIVYCIAVNLISFLIWKTRKYTK